MKEEPEESNKIQTKKRKYNKTGKYRKVVLDQNKEASETIENNVRVILYFLILNSS